MDLYVITQTVLELGVMPAILLVFIWYFLKRDKHRDEQLEAANKSRDDKLEAIREDFRERIAEGVKREELIRAEAKQQEASILQVADKREKELLRIIDINGKALEKACSTLDEIKNTLMQMEFRVKNIENCIGGKR